MIDQKLTTLLTLCECRSFTKTSTILNLTQPAVSQHIKALEQEFNVKIFNRTGKELILTDDGKIILKYARRIDNLYNNLCQTLTDQKKNIKQLTIGVTPTIENNIVASVFAKYCNENDNIHIKIISDSIKNLDNYLKTYQIDLAIIEGKMFNPNFKSILLDTDSLVLIVSNQNALAKKRTIAIEELKNEKLILRLPNSGTRSLFEANLKSNNESLKAFNIILEVDNVATIKELVQQNLGVSILAKSTCYEELRKNKFKALAVENLSMIREINMVCYKNFEHIDILNDIQSLYNQLSRGILNN